MKSFHVPLPDQTYNLLRTEAARAQVPATSLAREAIDSWLRHKVQKAKHDAIAAYALEMAVTEFDLDLDLEAAAVDHLLKTGKGNK